MLDVDVPLWINGQQRHSSDGKIFDVRNPLTKRVVSVSASATSEDCTEAIEAARRAFSTWEHTSPIVKRDIFLKAADLLQSDRYKAKLKQALQQETAATDFWVGLNVAGAVNNCREAAALATRVVGESFPSSSVPGAQVIVQRRAHGVILAIAPWNAPITLTVRAIAIPLICGNTVVLKSSEYSPKCQDIVVEAIHEAGIPPGCLNYVSMAREDSPQLTAEIIGHPAVRHINFTGSDRVGRILAAEAAKYLKPCVFELGGKAPAVVLEDADIDEAARAIVYGGMVHSGQVCMSTERVIVQRRAADALIPRLVELCKSLRAGDTLTHTHITRSQSVPANTPVSSSVAPPPPPLPPTIKIASDAANGIAPAVALSSAAEDGPAPAQLPALFSEASAENVLSFVKDAQEAGAKILFGDVTRSGAVVQPHVLLGVRPGMRAWDRESFGPVLAVVIVDTVDEAVELANASDYSLTASVWTRDVNLALDVAARVRSGCTSVNGSTVHSEVALGHAGLGGATGYGRFDIDHFTVKRMIVVNPPHRQYPLVG